MKNKLIHLMGIIIVSLYSPIFGATVSFKVDNLSYTVDTETQTAELYGPVSSSTVFNNLVIPDNIEYSGSQIPVTSIRNYAFSSNKNLKGSLTIGDNVQTIGNYAFQSCSGFSGSLTIGANVKTIGNSAFFRCSGFTGSLTIGYNVQTIGELAFYSCSGFTGSLTIGDNVQTIGEWAFSSCTGFTGSLTIGDNVQTIGDYAFQDCSGFTGSLTIGDNVQTIGNASFANCSGFTGSLIIPENVQTIGNASFAYCSGFTGSLIIPENVQSIGNLAFRDCSGFTGSLTIGDNVQTIGDSSFAYCSGFTGSLIIPENVQSIGNSAFRDCSGFTGSLTIGDNVQTIGNSSFAYCSGFTGSLIIPENVQSIGNSAFDSCSGFNGDLIIGKNIERIGVYAFHNCKGLTGKLILPFGLEYIGGAAFENCSSLKELIIPETVQYIGSLSFSGCKNLEGIITIPEGVETIYSAAFMNCEKISGLIISSTVKEIGVHKDLDGLYMGNTDAGYSFVGCKSLEYIICNSVNPPICYYETNFLSTLMSGGKNGIYDNVPLYVPAESVTLYKNAAEWKKFKSINPIPVEAAEITLNKNELSLLIGQEETLIATLQPEDATTEIVWSIVDDSPIISINQDGKVTALAVGEATVKATSGEVSASCKVTVNPILATSISIEGNEIHTLKQTETLQLSAIVNPENTTYQEIIWSSSDESKATVSTSGLVTAIEEGNVEIIATLTNQQEVSASYSITIQKRLLGDANDNGVVNVADVGTISDYIVEKPVYQFCFVNADVITDGKITIADVTATVDIIFNDTPSMAKFAKARKIFAAGNNELIVDNFNSSASSIVNINLRNPSEFTGLQGSIIIPEGVTVRNVKKGAGASNHILNYNATDHGTVEFILYSLQNATFDGMGSLIELEILADGHSGDLTMENILASDIEANEYSLPYTGGKNNDLITSLDRVENEQMQIYSVSDGIVILNAQGENANIFTIAGEKIVSTVVGSNKEFYSLTPGIYIVTVKSETAKLIVK